MFIFFKFLLSNQSLIISMAKRELANQYVGSFLGFLWTVINPLVTIFVFWVIFSVGFKVQPVDDVPFVVWLTAGMTAWYCFASIVAESTNSVVGSAQLIKKTLFPASILPIVKLVSGLVIHIVFLSILMLLLFYEKMPVSLYYLQFFYYLICMLALALGLGWFLAAINVFVKDTGHVVGVILQLGFWATPIFWNITIMPESWQFYFKLNPMFYIVQGYRESFIYFEPFWNHPYQALYFWTFTLLVLFTGIYVFKKLRPHFVDAL